METLAGGVGYVPVSFTTGPFTREAWYRVSLTLDQPAAAAGGAAMGAFQYGETEDYLLRSAPRKRKKPSAPPGGGFTPVCEPLTVPHGQTGTLLVRMDGPDALFVDLPKVIYQAGAKPVDDFFDFHPFTGEFYYLLKFRTTADPPTRVAVLRFKLTFTGPGNAKKKVSCPVTVVHSDKGGRPPGPTTDPSPIPCDKGKPCGGADPSPPAPDPKIDNANWRSTTYKGEKVAVLNVFSTSPLGRPVDAIFIPLANQSPPWQYARVVDSFVKNDAGVIGPASCGFAAPGGGAGGLLCSFASPIAARGLEIQLLIQVFNVVTGRQVDLPTVAIAGFLLYQGARAGVFSAAFK